jgi:hypothetical protein
VPHDLSSSWLKLGRANEHLRNLDVEIALWIERVHLHPDASGVNVERDGDWHVLTSDPLPEPLPIRLALIAGDAVVNIRAALDHAVCTLVRDAIHKEPRTNNNFPIFEDKSLYMTRVVNRKKPSEGPLYGIPRQSDAWTIILEAQPFNRPDPTPYLSHLSLLQGFSNRDKHRALQVNAPIPDYYMIPDCVGFDPSAQLIEVKCADPGPLSHDQKTEIARFRFAGPGDPGVHMKSRLSVNPTLGDGKRQIEYGAFDQMSHEIGEILARLAACQ